MLYLVQRVMDFISVMLNKRSQFWNVSSILQPMHKHVFDGIGGDAVGRVGSERVAEQRSTTETRGSCAAQRRHSDVGA